MLNQDKNKGIIYMIVLLVLLVVIMTGFKNADDSYAIEVEDIRQDLEVKMDELVEREKEVRNHIQELLDNPPRENRHTHGLKDGCDLKACDQELLLNRMEPTVIPDAHWCHTGDYHQRCLFNDHTKVCGCYLYEYKCCCGKLMLFGTEYCQRHVI
ncbi:hypothetical protein Amet_1306 [Alkaliphilus metalliredigens QYMF]|uniref:Uncharacterized protein n=1 Tax=Alkaliphilus metalliredigens (strain QYMF) TaxID=293826 RepID=A6TMU3_ALKMQ|nr:hypothetical protein [Alkaliphilus metalliredigens]ABR47511.1 hypothetical protein Amet_1306 [Alkaliphilus metalliredigens QYMF]